MYVGYDLYGLEEMVKRDDGIKEHEQGLGDFENIFHGSGCARFEVTYAVIPNIANSTSGQWRKHKAWYCGYSVF